MANEDNFHVSQPLRGMNLDSLISQKGEGGTVVSYALNAITEGSTNDSMIVYQNESANFSCCELPSGFKVVGHRNIIEENVIIVLLYNPTTEESEIGKVTSCIYTTYVKDKCLDFALTDPILEIIYKKTNCSTEIYWASNRKGRRFLDIYNPPYINDNIANGLDCNKLLINPIFSIPNITLDSITASGDNQAGVYQFAVQYSNAIGEGYTSFYTVTNPIPLFADNIVTLDFNYIVDKTINLTISNLDLSGYYDYINVAVIKTINNISSTELIGTYAITESTQKVNYSGQKQLIQLSLLDITTKYPLYEKADGVYNIQDVAGWYGMTTEERVSYQEIASQLKLQWESYRLKAKNGYRKELTAATLKSYCRDEIYALELVFLLTNGLQTDGFSIPARVAQAYDLQVVDGKPRWQQENTANYLAKDAEYLASTNQGTYEGPYEYGDFAYWESTDKYPNNTLIYGTLTNQRIRHHKFPDSRITHIHDISPVEEEYIYPLGIRVDIDQLKLLINTSSLTAQQKSKIAGFKIVRGNRATNKSVIARGILRNVLTYSNDGTPIDTDEAFDVGTGEPLPLVIRNLNRILANLKKARKNERVLGDPGNNALLQTRLDNMYNDMYYIITVLKTTVGISPNEVYSNIPPGIVTPSTPPVLNTLLPISYINRLDELITAINNQFNDIIIPVPSPDTAVITDGATNFLNIAAQGIDQLRGDYNRLNNLQSTATFNLPNSLPATNSETEFYFPNYLLNDTRITGGEDQYLRGLAHADSRYTFHSPDTSFFQPGLGSQLNVETIEYGDATGRFFQVKNHAGYKIYTDGLYLISIGAAAAITALSRWVVLGLSSGGTIIDGTAALQTYQILVNILERSVPYVNYAYQFNMVGDYKQFKIPTNRYKSVIDISYYLNSGMNGVGDDKNVNNWQRESSIYLKLKDILPYTHKVNTTDNIKAPEDTTKNFPGNMNLTVKSPTSVYYATIKNEIVNQWGQLYSYETIDTGYQFNLEETGRKVVFGGDTFINKFAFKTKLPFFTDNRVGAPDGSDIFYNELENVGQPKYWYTAKTKAQEGSGFLSNLSGTLFGTKAHQLYQDRSEVLYRSGQMFLFAYGIPYYYCESSVNVDLRQAFNSKEGDFFPHVGTSVPNDWLQEINVPIAWDNTYYYNKTFSKQNKETFFSHLSPDWDASQCRQYFPFRTVFSDTAKDLINPSIRNNWLIYKPASFFDLPQNYGKLAAINGIENKQVIARFENRTLLYNALLTAPTSTQSVYLGQTLFSQQTPPLDYADTDLGYVGSQHKFLLKTEYGNITCDAKRGQVFLLQGQKLVDLTAQGVSKFFIEYFNFYILRKFPTYPIDNAFNGIGLTGVYDAKYNRAILTKLDFECINENIKWDGIGFYLDDETAGRAPINPPPSISLVMVVEQNCANNVGTINVKSASGGTAPYSWYLSGFNNTPRTLDTPFTNLPNGTYTVVVRDSANNVAQETIYINCEIIAPPPIRNYIPLTDRTYFCNRSFTISYDFDNQAWISFHSYLPNFYIGEPTYFFSGINDVTSSIWQHSSSINMFNSFYGKTQPYILELPHQYKMKDEILQSIIDYSTVLQFDDFQEFIESDDYYFNKLILYSNQQCSGILKLVKKPLSNLRAYNEYPKYFSDSKEVLYIKSDTVYKVNTFWSLLKNPKKPVFSKNCENLSEFKILNQGNMDYNPRSYKKDPIRSKDLKMRYILDDRTDIKIQTKISLIQTQTSYK